MKLRRAAIWTLGSVLAVALLLSGILGYLYIHQRPAAIENIAWMPAAGPERLLVIAPHCDDETLGAAALMRDVAAAGGQVKVILMTNGDGFTFAAREQYHRFFLTGQDFVKSGYERQIETRAALAKLGIAAENILFLGYPDRGMAALWENYWDMGVPFRSKFTGYDHSPYSTSYHLSTPYAGEAVLADLQKIMTEFQPTLIVVPHPEDEHVDHAAAWAFAMAAMNRHAPAGQQPKVLTYLVHRGDFPIPHGFHPTEVLAPPLPVYQTSPDTWRRYRLDDEMVGRKESALREYHSQIVVPIMSSLLNSFIRTNELFATGMVPRISDFGAEMSVTDPQAWEGEKPLVQNPPAVNPLGVFEFRRSQAKVFCRRQGETLWLRVAVPQLAVRLDQLGLSVVILQHGPTLDREYYRIELNDIHHVDNIQLVQKQGETFIGITSKLPSPDQIFVQLIMRDRLGILMERSGWFPAEIVSNPQLSANK